MPPEVTENVRVRVPFMEGDQGGSISALHLTHSPGESSLSQSNTTTTVVEFVVCGRLSSG